jgi:hypothetical protein
MGHRSHQEEATHRRDRTRKGNQTLECDCCDYGTGMDIKILNWPGPDEKGIREEGRGLAEMN